MRINALLMLAFLCIDSVSAAVIAPKSVRAAATIFGYEAAAVHSVTNSSGEIPLKILASSVPSTLPLLIFISGDGGWNSFEEALCKSLNNKGVSVVVLDAQKYFWKSKTPDETATDVTSVIETGQKNWKKEQFVLAGFSFGASVVPFVANRLPAELSKNLVATLLISPDKSCDFEIHLSDMLNVVTTKGKYDVIREIQAGRASRMVAFFGSDERAESRQAFEQVGVVIRILQGNHHFDSGFEALAELIVAEMKK